MIQRIQSVFLIISAVAIVLLYFFPLAVIGGHEDGATLFIGTVALNDSAKVIVNAWPLRALCSIILILTLLSLFLYKRRVLQMRLTIYNMVLTFGMIGLGIFYLIQGRNLHGGDIQAQFFSIMPIISLILSYLAWRGIRRDYLMLSAVERLR